MVTDKNTGEPLPGVHVYITQTTVGTTTKEDGTFELPTRLSGSFKLVASFVGYNSQTEEISLDGESEPIELEFELVPASTEIGELEVKASNTEWQNYFNEFRKYFIGSSSFANETIIENAWSLNFEEDDENRLIAKTPEPLVVTNHALGYEIEIDLVEFKWNRGLDSGLYVIYTRFKELEPESDNERKKWAQNRRNAYRGSFEHFLKSLYQEDLTANQFEAVLQDSENRIQIAEVVSSNKSGQMTIHTSQPAMNDEHTKTFRLRGPTDILFGRNTGYSNSDNRDRSRIVPLNRAGTFTITEHGRLANPSTLRVDGAWAKDRVSKLLPVTYNPD